MASNYVCSGNLTSDSSLTDVSGSKVLNFSVAVNTGFGEKQQAHYIECALWGKRGEALHSKLVRATPVIVSGELVIQKYAKKDGGEGTSNRLNVSSFDFQRGNKPESNVNPQTMGQDFDIDSEIPEF